MAIENNNISGGGEMSAPQPSRAARFRYSDAPKAAVAAAAVALPMPDGGINWSRIWIAFAAAAACFIALYPSELGHLEDRWYSDAGWSHGFVVPLISLFFIRLKWDQLRRLTPTGTILGLAILIFGVAGQVVFRATGTVHMSNLSILVIFFGVVLWVFGWQYMKLLWLPIGYLIFALPPPNALYVKMTTPMQVLAAELGVHLLPLFGASGMREGTTIKVMKGANIFPIEVAQACSGMRMLVAFLALAVALAYSTTRPVWQKVSLALFALPVAIICNAFRVTLTGIMGVTWGEQYAGGTTHETLGLLMLIPALCMQLAAAWVLDKIFIHDDRPETKATPAEGDK